MIRARLATGFLATLTAFTGLAVVSTAAGGAGSAVSHADDASGGVIGTIQRPKGPGDGGGD
ncbi:hypothetical protein J5X84_25945 [Streptosporangiaceae bacterium NEAU-GS5]|nr:hypothetical protein [Streptosporangiaceae bacterium NEAU-GS5]